jgi:tetratricopeptide (TPR) repeat protein
LIRTTLFTLLLATTLHAQSRTQLPANLPPPPPPAPGSLAEAKLALGSHQFATAKALYSKFLRTHPDSGEAQLGLADSELALHEYETAELQYRSIVAAQPQLWIAHKNLVIVEAALHRWSEFDRERAILRDARQRKAPGIEAHESDVIDTFDVRGRHWIVREYDDLAGRSLTRYNFEHFGPEGHVQQYISLESAQAAQQALQTQDVVIGASPKTAPQVTDFALNFYTGKSHGTIVRFPKGEPTYETTRAAVIRWLQHQP